MEFHLILLLFLEFHSFTWETCNYYVNFQISNFCQVLLIRYTGSHVNNAKVINSWHLDTVIMCIENKRRINLVIDCY